MNTLGQIFTLSFSLFLLMDSIGNLPIFLSLLKDVPPKRQRMIIFRELLIALGIIILFNLVGEFLLSFIGVDHQTVMIAGGIILFLIALKMIFPSKKNGDSEMPREKDPFIVPLAVPLVAGPAVLAAVILYSHQTTYFISITAIIIAWVVSTIILLCSSALKNLLGPKGISACERLMGLILILIAIQMFLGGLSIFMQQNIR